MSDMLTVHYHRFDNNYDGVGLWTWDGLGARQPSPQEIMPHDFDEFGAKFLLDPALYGPSGGKRRIGLLPRLHQSWEFKDGGDRLWEPSLGEEVWLLSGDPLVYPDRPDVAPRIDNAWLHDHRVITARLSHGLELGRLVPKAFQLRCADGKSCAVRGVRALDAHAGKAHLLELVLESEPREGHELVLLADGYRAGIVERRTPGTILDTTLRDLEMGAICTPKRTTFRIFSPDAHKVHVVLYDSWHGNEGRTMVGLNARSGGIWEGHVDGDCDGRFYTIYADADGAMTRREVTDVYTRCASGLNTRGRIVDPRRLDPRGFRPVQRPPSIRKAVDAVIYEVHLRDFTIHESSGVDAERRGKYLGAIQQGARIPGTTLRTAIDHLVELGVTHVQLLPIQDFENDEDRPRYDWGYMSLNFFSPDGWYASAVHDASRVREVKDMIQAFHRAGIRVVMDVVYNHTGHYSNFESIAPGYYHRMREDGSFWNGSGTGNEFCSESPMGRKFILDCCKYWVDEYGVDGFRFDLMGLMDLETLRALRDELLAQEPTLLIYGEPWAATGPEGTGIGHPTYKDVVAGNGIGSFNDNFRNALKGDPEGPTRGYVQGASNRDAIKRGIEGSIHDWAAEPSDAIQYADCHDNLCLWDKIAEACPNAKEEDRVRMQMLTVGILAVSQGVMFLHGGVEFARTKFGHPNTYNQPDEINQFDWRRKQHFHDLFVYTKGMIALRRAHSVFRLSSRLEVENRLRFRDDLCPTGQCIAFTINGRGLEDERWKEALILVNPHEHDQQFNLPSGSWKVYTQGITVSLTSLLQTENTIPVAARSISILAR